MPRATATNNHPTLSTSICNLLSTDLLSETLSYCPLGSLVKLRVTCRLLCVLVHEHEASTPDFVSVYGRLRDMPRRIRDKCATTPTIGFFFPCEKRRFNSRTMPKFPPKALVLGAVCSEPLASSGEFMMPPDDGDEDEQHALTLMSLPEARAQICQPLRSLFLQLRGHEKITPPSARRELYRRVREELLGLDPHGGYKVFVVVGKDLESSQMIVHALQMGYPQAAILGGQTGNGRLFSIQGGEIYKDGGAGGIRLAPVVVLALSGNVPMQAIVSRGVSPLSPHTFKVLDWTFHDDEGFLLINEIQNNDAPGSSFLPRTVLHTLFDSADITPVYLGLRIEVDGKGEEKEGETKTKKKAPPFELLHYGLVGDGSIAFELPKPWEGPPANATLSIKYFHLSAESAQAHVKKKMEAVAKELAEKQQEVLGCLLFSCLARGPETFLDGDSDYVPIHVDLRAFLDAFTVKKETGSFICSAKDCGGFYAGGEVGPVATFEEEEGGGGGGGGGDKGGSGEDDGDDDSSWVLQNAQTGSAAMQGYTAVFGLFVKPKRTKASSSILLATQSLEAAVQQVLAASSSPSH